jgi:5-methylcytosine-specific restriction protein B
MQIDSLASELRKMYFGAAEKEKALSIHLFGIKFSDELDGKPCKEIAIRAGLPASYGTEIRKGVNLGRYVRLK